MEKNRGKRVYRSMGTCDCPVCRHGEEQGLVIRDKQHAYYLYAFSVELGIKYSDEPFNSNI
jgi:hypothetical protein